MYEYVKIDVDIREVLKDLDLTHKQMNSIAKKMMGKVFTEIKKQAKINTRRVLKKQSGNLLAGFRSKTANNFGGKVYNAIWYASFHEKGANVLKKHTVFPGLRFLESAVNDQFNTEKADRLMEVALQKELNKIWGVAE